MIRRINLIFMLLLLSSVIRAETVPVSRHILALYDSTEEKKIERTLLHGNAEVILNHLGLILDYHDINTPLPDDGTMTKYRGIITWFQDTAMHEPETFIKWLIKQIDDGKRVAILGSIGAMESSDGVSTDESLIQELYIKFGLEYLGNETLNPLVIDIVSKNSEWVEFERPLDFETTYYKQLKPIRDDVTTHLELKRTDLADSSSSAVITCNTGSMVIQSYVIYFNPEDYTMAWRINPFLLFSKAFDMESMPKPDAATLFGSRILFTHIDGDAFISLSQVDGKRLCGEVIIEEIMKKYPIPTSASIVAGEVVIAEQKPWIDDVSRVTNAIREMYKIPYIEPAAHGYTHPLHWSKNITALVIPPYSVAATGKYAEMIEDTEYESLSMDMGIINGSMEDIIDMEIVKSFEMINQWLPEGSEPTHLFFWTGNCSPTNEVLEFCMENGIRNINGGDPIFDAEHNSYTFLCPIRRQTKKGLQIYTAACNENIYTNLWQGPYFGFRKVINTFERTEHPLRIKPANIYYHFYSGEKIASLSALNEIYQYAISQEYFPTFASHYIDTAHSWFNTKIDQENANTFIISEYGACQTIRFDNETRYPDLEKSSSVLGFMHYQNSLYVHLATADTATISLTGNKPKKTYLKKSTAGIQDFAIANDTVSFSLTGFGQIIVELANLRTDTSYSVSTPDYSFTFATDTEGLGRIIFPVNPIVKKNIAVTIKPARGDSNK
ncbi:MAG: hypothetical protein AB1454_04410 [Candidatus Auribacterota bacterium]